jgi:hypothetical protein
VDQVDNEPPQRKIDRVREGVAVLEYSRQTTLFEKHVIGRVSNKKRDLAGELAVIPKRVPFKWQRGNKIGKTLIRTKKNLILTWKSSNWDLKVSN